MMPAASIIMPVYNKANYLSAALDSIFSQSCADFELIIIDDGSTDGSPKLLADIADQRARIITQKNSGVSSARNRGIQLARSPVVLFFDADDWMHPDYLHHQLQTIARHPRNVFFASAFKRFPARETSPGPDQAVTDAPAIVISNLPRAWMTGQTFITSCVAVRRSALMDEPSWFPVGESFGEDMDLWLRLAERHALVLQPQALIGYREGAVGSLTSMKSTTTLPAYIGRLETRAQSMPRGSALRLSTLNYAADARVSLARHLMAQGLRLKSGRALLAALPRGFCRPRWWVTLAMGALFPRNAVSAWERYRIARTQRRV